jgi:hypothetical protein
MVSKCNFLFSRLVPSWWQPSSETVSLAQENRGTPEQRAACSPDATLVTFLIQRRWKTENSAISALVSRAPARGPALTDCLKKGTDYAFPSSLTPKLKLSR